MDRCILDTDILSEYLKGHNSVTVYEIVYGLDPRQSHAARAPLELTDCLIAAAVRLGRPLVTGNTDDLQAIQKTGAKLIIDNWRKPLPQKTPALRRNSTRLAFHAA